MINLPWLVRNEQTRAAPTLRGRKNGHRRERFRQRNHL